MVKKMFYVLMALLFICALTITSTPVYAQEEEEEVVEDVADISLEDLLNVEITTAGRRAEKIGEVPASVVVVTREDIEKYGYQDLAEVLENIPGLFQTNDWQSKNFGVRGFWTVDPQRNVIVLVNDVPQTDALTSGNWLEYFNIPPDAIDRIEVVRGPMSVIYGTGAFFGVINIKTNIADPEKPVNQVTASYGSDITKRLMTRLSGKEGDFQYAFTGSYFDTDGIDIPYDLIGDPAVLEAWGILPDQTTKELFENEEKYFNFSGFFKGFNFGASYSESDREFMAVLPSLSEGTRGLFHALRMFFGWKEKFSDKVTLDSKFTYFRNRRELNYDWLFPGFFGIQNDVAYGYDAEVDLFISPTPQVNFTIGATYRKILEVENTISVPTFGLNLWNCHMADGESIITQSLFAQLNWKLSPKFSLVAGARVEQVPEYTMELKVGHSDTGDFSARQTTYSFTKAEFIPRVALIFLPTNKHAIKLLYGKAINRPSFFQMAEETYYLPGVPKPEPETIQTFEFNYIGTWSPQFSLSMSLFYNQLDKLIFRYFDVIGGTVISYYSNVGEMTTTGAEMTITAKPSEKFTLELSGTYQDTKDKREGFEDIDVAYSPKFLGYVKASLFLNKDISIAVTGTYVDKMESYYDSSIPGRLGDPVDAYFLLGANLRIRNLFGTGMFLNIRGSNLLDKEIHYPTTSVNSLFASKGTVGRGMSFLATLGFRFMPMPRP